MRQFHWTLAALAVLGGQASADPNGMPAAEMSDDAGVRASSRGVAEDYLVLPEGGELTGQMKFIMSDPLLGAQPLHFTDLALFGLTGRWALFSKLEVGASVDFLPKQPSYTDEKSWQSVGATLRSPIGEHAALALSGGGGHLLDSTGSWTRESLTFEWKKPIDREWLAFDMQAGLDGTGIARGDQGAFMTELAFQTAALFREPTGHWGSWLGIAYAVPVQHNGVDPTTDMAIDPQPRVDFHVGTVLAIVHEWDLFAEFAVVDRGDLSNPATRLPILDGGFDQKQIIFGVTRHLDPPHHRGPPVDEPLAL
ncbi:MAG TPA: hypothetical protein VMJ10_05715 [Kofleriaceae bacterium]|nr:hypothetical protein [Kofleriaceae bacterium]